MTDKYDAIVIGSGLGGSVCAALLAKAGMKTLVLEKNNQPGGKAMGISVKGFRGELWPTYGIPQEGGPFVEAFQQLGIESKLDVIPGSSAMMYRRKGEAWTTMVDAPGVKVRPLCQSLRLLGAGCRGAGRLPKGTRRDRLLYSGAARRARRYQRPTMDCSERGRPEADSEVPGDPFQPHGHRCL